MKLRNLLSIFLLFLPVSAAFASDTINIKFYEVDQLRPKKIIPSNKLLCKAIKAEKNLFLGLELRELIGGAHEEKPKWLVLDTPPRQYRICVICAGLTGSDRKKALIFLKENGEPVDEEEYNRVNTNDFCRIL